LCGGRPTSEVGGVVLRAGHDMSRVLRSWYTVTLCALLCAACISDLKPEVGKLKPTTSDDAVGEGMNGSGNGASTSDDNGGSNANASGGKGPSANNTNGATGDNAGASAGDGDGGPVSPGDAAIVPDGGPDIPDNGCNIKDSNPKQDVSFDDDIWPILSGCSCHDPNDNDPAGVLEVGFVIDSYVSLRMGGDNSHADIIVDGNPCKSILLQKLGEPAPFGVRMPRDGPYLSPEVQTLISDWIIEGARDN